MKKRLISLVCAFIFLGNATGFSQARFQADYWSSYIWRGFDLNPDRRFVFQPSLDYEFGDSGISANLWMSFSFEDKELNETDLTVTYDFSSSEELSLEAGFIHYGWYFTRSFRFNHDTTHEIFFSAGLPSVFLEPSLDVYYDFHNGKGLYFQLNAGHSLTLSPAVGLDLSASLGYNGGQWLPEDAPAGFSDMNLGMDIVFEFARWALVGSGRFTAVLMDALGIKEFLYFGISFIYTPGEN